jgi:hypothetical protein
MISFGQVWEAKLKGLWKDSSLSLSEVERRLGVDPLTARRHAARLKLLPSRSGRRPKPLNPDVQLKGTRDPMVLVEKRRAYRAKWIAAMRQSPKITLKALRRKHPREYAWLLQNNPEWLRGTARIPGGESAPRPASTGRSATRNMPLQLGPQQHS